MTPSSVRRTVRTPRTDLVGSLSAIVLAAFVLGACSPSTGGNVGPSDQGGGGAPSGAGGAVVPGGGGSPAQGAGGFMAFGATSNGTGGASDLPDGACGAQSLKAESVIEKRIEKQTVTETRVEPVALYVMQDQSGSMGDKWGYAVQAIQAFVSDPRSVGVDVAIMYFPTSGPFCIPDFLGGQDCTGGRFATPEVPFGRLTTGGAGTQNQAIIDNLGLHLPCGAGTPIEGALRGVTQGCIAFEQGHPGEDCYGLLITDGAPSGCAGDAPTLTGIAAAALAAGVETYAVGMPGADYTLLDAIAQAGGTDCNGPAAGLTCNAASGAEFTAALAAIRETVTDVREVEVEVEVEVSTPLACEWTLPSANGSDPQRVNVDFTDGATAALTELLRVPGQAECASTDRGWYYDDPAVPTRLIACADVCERIKATAQAKIDILVGCEVRTPDDPR